MKDGSLPTVDAASKGVDPAALSSLTLRLEREGLEPHGLVVVCGGATVFERAWRPYTLDRRHILWSLSKSFMSTAVGMAIGEGALRLEDRVVEFFPELLPAEVSENLAAMTLHDCLAMATGHESEPYLPVGDPHGPHWIASFLEHPVVHVPGRHFLYNTPASYAASAMLQRATGKTLTQYLTPRLFEPLGIENPVWWTSPQGVDTGGFGLSLSVREIARFGQLYLQRGRWGAHQLVPESYVLAATQKQVENGTDPDHDWQQGYGYQFWRCRHGAYRGDGAFGQFCIVCPDQDLVVAILGGGGDMGATLNAVWEELLPGVDRAPGEGVALGDPTVASPVGERHSGRAELVSGKTFAWVEGGMGIGFARFTFGQDRVLFETWAGRYEIGLDDWVASSTSAFQGNPSQVSAQGAWTGEDTFAFRVLDQDGPMREEITATFHESEVTLTRQRHAVFGEGTPESFVGRVEGTVR